MQKVEFYYCQYDTAWEKVTIIMSVGNTKFHVGCKVKCKSQWTNGVSICSRTGTPHETLSGFINGAQKGQYKTNRACPYPVKFFDYVAQFISEPDVQFYKRHQTGEIHGSVQALVAGPKVSIAPPPPEHYLTHLPKHPGCAACMDCKVQRKHCRDQTKARQRRKTEVIKMNTPHVDDEIEEGNAPKNFGDLATSDSIFAIKRNVS